MFKNKTSFALIPLFGIIGVGALCSANFNERNIKAAFAEEPTTAVSSIKMKKYRRSDNFDYGTLYENNEVNTQEDVELAKSQLTDLYMEVDEDVDYAVTTIELLDDSSLDYTIITEGTRFELLLRGHTCELASKSPWYLLCEQFTLKGESGTIDASQAEEAAFLISIDETIDGKVEIFDTTFNDFASEKNATFDIDGTYDENSRLVVNFTNCNFVKSESEADGGAISIARAFDSSFTNCNFERCLAKCGGALCMEDILYKAKMDECTFLECDAELGGAIYIDTNTFDNALGSAFQLNQCSAENCSSDYGGFAFLDDESLLFSSLDFDTTITDCKADLCGGAIYIAANNTYVEGFTFEDCYSENGGGVYIDAKSATISGCTFDNCDVIEKGSAIYSTQNLFIDRNVYLDAYGDSIDESKVVYIEHSEQPIAKETFNYTPIWVMGSLIAAALIGSVVAFCLVFGRKKKSDK